MRRLLMDDSHEQFAASVRTFVEREVLPFDASWEAQGYVDRVLFERAGAAGLLSLGIPEHLGGGGVPDFQFNAIVMEEFCRNGVMNAVQGITLQNNVVLPYYVEHANP